MNNPYEILKVSQNANKAEIMKAQMLAMREKKHSLQEIQIATRQLLDPAKRLAADFMFPTKMKTRRPQLIMLDIVIPEIDISILRQDVFDSLK